jgi:hypothetical protein
MATHSGILGRWALPADDEEPIFTVPADTTWIVKSIYASTNTGPSPWLYVRVDNGAGGFNTYILSVSTVRWVPAVWSGWLVLNAGCKLWAFSQNVGSSGWVSGARLLGTAP